MRTGGPKGTEWKKDDLPTGSKWRQWSHPTGTIRKEFSEYIAIFLPNGDRTFTGNDGGILSFTKTGGVEVIWDYSAVLASLYGSGNRQHPITISRGKRKPPKLPPQAAFVVSIRSLFILPTDEWPEGARAIPGLPDDPNDPLAIDLVTTFQKECFHLLSTIVRGDASEFRRIADCLEINEKIRTGAESILPVFSDLGEAIREAAIRADGIPTRAEITREYIDLTGVNGGLKDLRDELARMGFAWLHGPIGRPPRNVGKPGG